MTRPLCLVPARGREPDLPKKNFKRIDGTPLVGHTIETALDAPSLSSVYVTTESDRLADVAVDHGATVPFTRPAELASRETLLADVVDHALDELAADGVTIPPDGPVVVLQPNVPFLRERDIEAALERFREGAESVVSAVEERQFFWREEAGRLVPRFRDRVRTDELEPFYRETGSIRVTTPRLVADGRCVGDRPDYVVTNKLAAHEVDSVLDIWMAERIASGPTVVFRVDGGGDIGMGHVSRCLTLATELERSIRCDVTFVSDGTYPSGVDAITDNGFDVVETGETPIVDVRSLDPDIVFFDVLDTAPGELERLHESAAAVINLEDLGGGLEAADVVINALYDHETDGRHRYNGPDYFILRDEFDDVSTAVTDSVDRVLATFGGSDPANVSRTAALGLARADIPGATECRLVLGPAYHATHDDTPLPDCEHVDIRTDVAMGPQIQWADVALAAGGRTAYELIATGTPTLAVAQNDREHERLESLAARNAVDYLGPAPEVAPTDIAAALETLVADRERRRTLADNGRGIVDGQGTRRILDVVEDVLFG